MIERAGAYFNSSTDGLQPVPEARSPWSAAMLHGRLLAGLVARAVEGADHDPALRVARLTVDMFRSPPMSALQVTTSTIRSGRRVRVMEVSISSTDVEVARASALLLRGGPHPDAMPWSPPEWDAPLPEVMPVPGEADDPGGWEIRLLTPGGFWSAERKRLWTRDRWQLVSGEDPSRWIGVEVVGHLGHDGIAIGSCALYDTSGAIGSSTVSAITNSATLGE